MYIEAKNGKLRVRVGPEFGHADVARLREAITTLGPFSNLTVDFSVARACDDSALALLAQEFASHATGEIALTGLTEHHWQLLAYLGLEGSAPATRAT